MSDSVELDGAIRKLRLRLAKLRAEQTIMLQRQELLQFHNLQEKIELLENNLALLENIARI